MRVLQHYVLEEQKIREKHGKTDFEVTRSSPLQQLMKNDLSHVQQISQEVQTGETNTHVASEILKPVELKQKSPKAETIKNEDFATQSKPGPTIFSTSTLLQGDHSASVINNQKKLKTAVKKEVESKSPICSPDIYSEKLIQESASTKQVDSPDFNFQSIKIAQQQQSQGMIQE